MPGSKPPDSLTVTPSIAVLPGERAAASARDAVLCAPCLAFLVLAPLLPTEVEPSARLLVALLAAVSALSMLHPRVPATGSGGLWLALAALPLLVLGCWLGADAGAARSRLLDFAPHLRKQSAPG